jgi:glycosyltransferase involved in cell wall biosynthesis
VAVSSFTRSRISQHYGIEPQRIRVIYNGLDAPDPPAWSRQGPIARPAKASGQRHVLFLGRVTAQKGPDFFLDAAKKVLSQQKNVKFIIAGTGDRIEPIIDRAAREGIGRHVLFTGFLRGSEVQRVYQMADLFVMPSVSEPFGLATLEAVSHEVPVIVSRQAGVAEVLDSALKVDFWDTDEVAEKILAVLSRPALSQTLRDQAGQELRRLTWDHAAAQTTELYHQITAGA